MEALPARNFIIDGELVVLDAAGLPSFDDLTRRDCDATLCAFDILFGDGRDLRGQPLSERRRRLGTLLDRPPSCIVMPGAFAEGHELLAEVEKMGLEGFVSKRLDMPYRSGANCGWVKVKTKAWQAIGQERHRRFGPRR